MKLTTCHIPEIYIDAVEFLVGKGVVPNRSEAIRMALRDYLKSEFGTFDNMNKEIEKSENIKKSVEKQENTGVFITNNIGDVDVLTQPVRDRTTDNQGVALQTDAIMSDTTALTPKFAVIDDASSGDNTLVAAVADKKIRVLAF